MHTASPGLQERSEDLCLIEALDSGKPLSQIRSIVRPFPAPSPVPFLVSYIVNRLCLRGIWLALAPGSPLLPGRAFAALRGRFSEGGGMHSQQAC